MKTLIFIATALAQPVVNEATISADAAMQVAQGALAACRQDGPQLLPNITSAAGGVPIRSGDRVVGAVGVSGTAVAASTTRSAPRRASPR